VEAITAEVIRQSAITDQVEVEVEVVREAVGDVIEGRRPRW
jgi:hypothetical protein